MKTGLKIRSTRPSVRQRFKDKVTKSGPRMPGIPTPCWNWTGAVDGAGYPKVKFLGQAITAQRAHYLLTGAELRTEQQAINICCNRKCVRPDHLVLGTRKDAQALSSRGKAALGPGDLWFIRQVVADDEVTAKQVAEAYNLSIGLVEQLTAQE